MLEKSFVDPRKDTLNETLYVVTAISNPLRYSTRYRLYSEFEKYITDSGAVLYTIEAALGRRNHAVTKDDNPRHIQLRTKHVLWHKENLLNLAITRLPSDWRYVAWIDADIMFARPDWVEATLHALQHYHVVQMFSESADLTHRYGILTRFKSFVWCFRHPDLVPPMQLGYYTTGGDKSKPYYWHPGYAWAWRRKAFDDVGGLIDFAILGGGDTFMARGLFNMLHENQLPKALGEIGRTRLLNWQTLAQKYINQNVGYLDGLLLHYWHGRKSERGYKDRGQILTDAHFDPGIDLKRDWQGLWQLNSNSKKLRDSIRTYFAARNEDSIDP